MKNVHSLKLFIMEISGQLLNSDKIFHDITQKCQGVPEMRENLT